MLMPSALAALGLVLGIALLWVERFRRAGRALVTVALISFLLLGWGVPFASVGRMLERRYPPLLDPSAVSDARWVVVLGGGHQVDSWLPVTSRPSESSIYRITEGVRLQRALPGSQLVFTGFGGGSAISVAAVGRDLALALGTPPESVLIDERPRTTEEEAVAVMKLVGTEPFVLVTSAVHMPRAMHLFHTQGLRPVPAPTQHHAVSASRSFWGRLIPRPERVVDADAAWHEVLGIVWAKALGR